MKTKTTVEITLASVIFFTLARSGIVFVSDFENANSNNYYSISTSAN